MRSYELMFVVDPRLTEEEAGAVTSEFRNQAEAAGAQIVRVENWGRRKLAYEIKKLKEGRYVLFYLLTEDGAHSLADVEHRLEQHDQVLRYMLIRTDLDLKRAGLPLPSANDGEAPASAAPAPARARAAEADDEEGEE
jgi:small subunit ribosomal protein S6